MTKKYIYKVLLILFLIRFKAVSFASSNIFELNATNIDGDKISRSISPKQINTD